MKRNRCRHQFICESINDQPPLLASYQWVSVDGNIFVQIFKLNEKYLGFSTESGIIADMSMSPDADTANEQQLWSTCHRKSTNSSTTSSSSTQQTDQKPTDEFSTNIADPYTTVDSIAVHL